MPEYGTRHNAADLLAALRDKGLAGEAGLADFIIQQRRGKPPLLYLNILITIGALLAALCLVTIFPKEDTPIVVTLALIASAVWLKGKAGDSHGLKYTLLMQSSLAVMIAGKLLFTGAVGKTLTHYLSNYSYDPWSYTLALLMITVLTYPVYRVPVDRFLFPFIVLCFLLFNILEDSGQRRILLFHGFFLLQFAMASVLLTHRKIRADYMPLAYALVFSLCVHVLILATGELASYVHVLLLASGELASKGMTVISHYFASLILTGGLIALFGWAAGDMAKLKTQPLLLASTGALLLGLIAAPGMLLAIMLLVLGYARHERPLLATGVALIPVFLFLYYYQLDLSLLQKSAALAGSGALLLAGRFYLRRRGWDKAGKPCA